MKEWSVVVCVGMIAGSAIAVDNFGIDEKYGTFNGRVQTISMFRDYEREADHNYSHSASILLDYLSPEMGGLQVGLSYLGAEVIDAGDYDDVSRPGQELISNGRVNVLNEGYLQYRLSGLNASNTVFTVGRRAQKGEIFRYTEARHKKRSLEGVFLSTKDISGLSLSGGHTWKMSNIYGTEANAGLSWEFDDYGEVFSYKNKAALESDGVTFVEGVYTGVKHLEVAVFDAHAWDIANLIGARMKYDLGDNTAISGLYRNESDVGSGIAHNADSYGVALIQKIGGVTLEGGYFGVSGDNLYFEENTTGINHPLGLSLMLDSAHFNGGADTVYLKAVTKLNKTILYGLLNATWHSKQAFDGQELDLVVKQPITDNFTVCFKGGLGLRQNDDGTDSVQTDGRVFLTYKF